MTQLHQLAAIMFTDIVSYTVFTGNDEQNSFSLLKKTDNFTNLLFKYYHQ
jgi:hypothetical protein